MNPEQNNVCVDAVTDSQPTAEQPQNEKNQTLRKHYLLLVRQMCPNMSADKTDDKKLVALQNRALRMIEMLTLFERSWREEMPILQKACLSYLGTENLSRKERQQVIDAWGDWVDFQFKLTPHHELIEQSLRYYHSICRISRACKIRKPRKHFRNNRKPVRKEGYDGKYRPIYNSAR